MLDQQVTQQGILDALRKAAQATTADDTLVFFYAGHGGDGTQLGQKDVGLVLTTPGTRLDALTQTAIPWSSISDALAESRGTVVVLLDACHSGLAGSVLFATNDAAVEQLMKNPGAPLVVLAGSKGRQQTFEKGREGGLFTNAIVAAMTRAPDTSPDSSFVDLGQLYTAVKGDVVRATRGRQTPWLARNRLVGEMSLF